MGAFRPFFAKADVRPFRGLFQLFEHKNTPFFAKKQAKRAQIRVNLLFTHQTAALSARHNGFR